MKLAPFFVVASLVAPVIGCTKQASPEFAAEVREWQAERCACYQTDPACPSKMSPRTELSSVEHMMINAGLLTDRRREIVRGAEATVTMCATSAVARNADRARSEAIDASLKKLDLHMIDPAQAKRVTTKPR